MNFRLLLAWLESEPVRVRLYGLAVLALTYLSAKGIVTSSDVSFYVAVVGTVLSVESARALVTPTVKAAEPDTEAAP